MASEKDNVINTVSKSISKTLNLIGFSSYGTLIAKNWTLIQDFLHFSVFQINEMFYGGSTAEGTKIVESDLDSMVVVPYVTVLTDHTDPERMRGQIFLLDPSGSRPGFGRLRLVQLEHQNYLSFETFHKNIQKMLRYTNEGTYLSSEKFLNCYISDLRSNEPTHPGASSYYQHGPCVTVELEDIHGYVKCKPSTKRECDKVFALQCLSWPVEAKEWITRERLHDWPPNEVVDKISHQKCHVVPIGDVLSSSVSLEWRISFLLGERELVWNFNNTQVHCYVLLKMLLKTYIKPLACNQLSSYHMKTVMFWLSEEKGLSVWFDENLLWCVAESLKMLKSCIVKEELHHYFNRQCNLLACKLKDLSEKRRVLLKIEEIQEHIVMHALKCMDVYEPIYQPLVMCCFYYDYTRVLDFANAVLLSELLFMHFAGISSQRNPFCVLRQLKEMEKCPPANVMPLFQEKTKIFLGLQVGIAYFGNNIDYKDNLFQDYIRTISFTEDDAVRYINRAVDIDFMSGALYLATLRFRQGNFLTSNEIVLSVLKRNENLMYPCKRSRHISIQLTPEGKSRQRSDICCKEGTIHPTYDVIFSFQHLHFVPHPVKFECALTQYDRDNCFMIHPCVYAYFMLCYGQYLLGGGAPFQDFLSQLEETVREIDGGNQRYRAFNLLGYCYFIDGNLIEAFRCFKKSLEETRDLPLVNNAAVYHIGFLIVHLLKVKEKQDTVRRKQ